MRDLSMISKMNIDLKSQPPFEGTVESIYAGVCERRQGPLTVINCKMPSPTGPVVTSGGLAVVIL